MCGGEDGRTVGGQRGGAVQMSSAHTRGPAVSVSRRPLFVRPREGGSSWPTSGREKCQRTSRRGGSAWAVPIITARYVRRRGEDLAMDPQVQPTVVSLLGRENGASSRTRLSRNGASIRSPFRRRALTSMFPQRSCRFEFQKTAMSPRVSKSQSRDSCNPCSQEVELIARQPGHPQSIGFECRLCVSIPCSSSTASRPRSPWPCRPPTAGRLRGR